MKTSTFGKSLLIITAAYFLGRLVVSLAFGI